MSNNSIYLVGLVGYKYSGKDTVAGFLRQQFSYGFEYHRVAFADTMKDEVCKELGCSREFLEENKQHFREYLQHYGQKAKESRGSDVWVKEVIRKINELRSNANCKPQLFVITDVRFPFEADWIRSIGGALIKIERFESTEDKHPSEKEVDNIRVYDWTLPNKKKLADLEREVRWIAGFLRERWKI